MEEYCSKEIRCQNSRQDHPAYLKSYDIYKKEKKILEIKHKKNVSFLEARNIIASFKEKKYLCLYCTKGGYNQSKEQI